MNLPQSVAVQTVNHEEKKWIPEYLPHPNQK
jgi:hypothetical protein